MASQNDSALLTNFFKLNDSPATYKGEDFKIALRKDTIRDCAVFEPLAIKRSTISTNKIENKLFENVSFLHKRISGITFHKCTFRGCLFNGARFDGCEFHDCQFVRCNFFKAKFSKVYGRLSQFHGATPRKGYANIGVALYQSLLDNYSNESQREDRVEADYYFRRWQRRNEAEQIKFKKISPSQLMYWSWRWRNCKAWLNEIFLGYGCRSLNMFLTIIFAIAVLSYVNELFEASMYSPMDEPHHGFGNSLYFTFTTMSTLGACGFNPVTSVGKALEMLDVGAGLFLISNVFSASLKRILP